ncbi:ABC transporter permease, partial [bacterium]|nr:ABC transporter permease [bacterium]
TPVVSFAPFAVVGYIGSLVSLDYLGFGLAPPTPSWGQLVQQGMDDVTTAWWLVLTPLAALFFTLLMVTFIGEAVREAFDPKVFSRLR